MAALPVIELRRPVIELRRPSRAGRRARRYEYLGRPRRSKGELCHIGKGKSSCRNGPFWAAVSANLAAFAGGKTAMAHDLGPPEGSVVNFFAKMANAVLRSRAKVCATAQPAPAARIALSTRQEGLVRPMMAWARDLRCIPTSLANKIPAASNSRGGYCREKTVPPPVTTSPIDSPSIGAEVVTS